MKRYTSTHRHTCIFIPLVLLFIMFSITIKAQNEVQVWGYVVEDFTYQPVYDVTYTVMTSDSIPLYSQKTGQGDSGGRPYAFATFPLSKAGKYIIKCEKDGYETTYNDYEIKKIHKSQKYVQLDTPFFIKRIPKSKKLKEVTVKATKIKFYSRGDTLVYNADAFELEEGSMLDALIQQLPDVELKEGGQIYVRGKRVNELLLNGRDFFNGDRHIILENLPSYMVNNVKVYEREDSIRKKTDPYYQKSLSMDIQLKKKYSIGWIANAEAGAGTKEKMLGRLFALRFTPHSRLSLFASANNLNDDRKPGNNGDWSPLQQSVGQRTVYKGGLDYNIEEKKDRYRINGSLVANYTEGELASTTNRENFLTGGNTFGKSFYRQKSYSSGFNTSHSFSYRHKIHLGGMDITTFRFMPTLSYNNNKHNSATASATLSEDANKILGSNWKEELLSMNSSEALRTYGLNRTLQREKGHSHQFSTGTSWNLFLESPYNDNIGLYLYGNINYLTSRSKRFDHYTLQYFKPADTDFRNRYDFNKNRAYSYNVRVSHPNIYVFSKPSLRFNASYKFSYKFQERNRSLYLLNKLDSWGVDSLHALGDLPSVNEMLSLLDANSYQQTQTDKAHEASLNIQYGKDGTQHLKRTIIQASFVPTIRFENNHINYYRKTVIDTTFSRNNVFFEPFFDLSAFPVKGSWADRWMFNLQYNLKHDAPSMIYLIGVTDNSNPLNIMKGNKHLKNASTHHVEMDFNKPLSRKRNLNMAANANIYTDKVALGYVYDRQTGVRTITPDNVNGNWNAAYSITYRSRLDKNDRWTFQTATGYTYINSVDLIGTSATANRSVRSRVSSSYIIESAYLRYNPNTKMDFYLKGAINYQNAQSTRENFSTINVCDFNYGVVARIELPLSFQLSTDMTMYSRRGYNDPSMNTNDLVWNARISKRFMHGNLVCMLDAFDLLGNLSNVRRSIDAQGRVETWNNVTPHFALLHVIYRFNKQPKKNK